MPSPIEKISEINSFLEQYKKKAEKLIKVLSKGKISEEDFEQTLERLVSQVDGFSDQLSSKIILKLKRQMYVEAISLLNSYITDFSKIKDTKDFLSDRLGSINSDDKTIGQTNDLYT